MLAALALGVCGAGASRVFAAPSAPFELIVPYFTVVGDVRGSKSVSVYRVDASTGAVARAAGSPFPAGRDPHLEALAPGGRFAYVVNDGSHSISAYAVDENTGALRPVTGSPFPLDYSPSAAGEITIAPTGTFAYVASGAGISAFSIDATTGALAPVPGSPFARVRSDGYGTASIAIDPAARFAYVLNYFSNTISQYAIEKNGALEPAGAPVDAGQNSNDPGALTAIRIDPKGTFLYASGRSWLSVYAIDPASGALARPARTDLGIGDNTLRGFAIDPAGRFAYAIDSGRIYSYAIGASGALAAVTGRKFSASAGEFPDAITIDPTGRFAYAYAPGGATAPALFAYRIDSATGALTPLARSPFAVAAGLSDPVHRWFNAGRCPAFDGTLAADGAPLAKRDSDGVIFDRRTANVRGYVYDPTSRFALHYPNTDSGATLTLRLSAPPPAGVRRNDLSKLRTASGITLGSLAKTVEAALGKPKIVRGCGLQRYVYLRSTEGEPTSLQFTIDNGRVTEIFEDFGG